MRSICATARARVPLRVRLGSATTPRGFAPPGFPDPADAPGLAEGLPTVSLAAALGLTERVLRPESWSAIAARQKGLITTSAVTATSSTTGTSLNQR